MGLILATLDAVSKVETGLFNFVIFILFLAPVVFVLTVRLVAFRVTLPLVDLVHTKGTAPHY